MTNQEHSLDLKMQCLSLVGQLQDTIMQEVPLDLYYTEALRRTSEILKLALDTIKNKIDAEWIKKAHDDMIERGR